MKQFELDKDLIVEADEEALNNMELLDTLVEVDEGHPEMIGKVLTLMFGKAQKKKIYDHYRTEKGNVPVDKIVEVLESVFKSAGQEEKN